MDQKYERHRTLDEELDLKDIGYSDFQFVGAERIPMKVIQNPSDIWIPDHLLRKREQLAEKQLNKPALFRTLEKYYPSFSIYAEPHRQPKSFSAVDFAHTNMLHLLNNCRVNFEEHSLSDRGEETTSVTKPSESSENNNFTIYDSDTNESLGSSNKNVNLECIENNFEPYDECEENIYDYIQSACSKTFIKSKDDNFKKSLVDIYNSEDEFSQENACTTVEEIQVPKSQGSCEPLNISEPSIGLYNEKNQEPCVENGLCEDTYLEVVNQIDISNSTELSYPDNNEYGTETLINYPDAYKRPAIEENVKKQKNSKKKKNSQKKKVLDVFSQDGNSDRMEPEVDEFYQSVMLREFQEHRKYEYQYPSLQNKVSNLNHYSCQEYYSSDENMPKVTSGYEELRTENDSACISAKGIGTVQREDVSVPLKLELNIENVEISEDFKDTCKIRIENIPTHASEDQVQDVVVGYGCLVRLLYFSSCRKFQIAEVSVDINFDPDWIIECLNGTEPFGGGTGFLKCYKLS